MPRIAETTMRPSYGLFVRWLSREMPKRNSCSGSYTMAVQVVFQRTTPKRLAYTARLRSKGTPTQCSTLCSFTQKVMAFLRTTPKLLVGNRKFWQIKSSEARKAAEQGDTEAQVSLGQMYEDGYGVSKDIPEAIRRYRLANRAMPEGLHCLGSCMKTASMYRGIMSKHTCGSTSPQPKGTNLPPKAGTASNM